MLMTAYRLFCLDHSRKITHAAVLDAADDSEAIGLAQAARFDAVTCEVWDVDRLVTTFEGRNSGAIHGR
jgi:hypothetical protein